MLKGYWSARTCWHERGGRGPGGHYATKVLLENKVIVVNEVNVVNEVKRAFKLILQMCTGRSSTDSTGNSIW